MDKEPDWSRIAHLMKLGFAAALMVLAGDMLLGWGMHDAAKGGMEGFLSAYLNLSDGRIFWSALLGLMGIPLEALCCFALYRLIMPYSSRLAHLYRSGILGVLAFAGCGGRIVLADRKIRMISIASVAAGEMLFGALNDATWVWLPIFLGSAGVAAASLMFRHFMTTRSTQDSSAKPDSVS